MVDNIDPIHAKILGQCKEPLEIMIKYIDKLFMKHKKKDVIWLLKNPKIFSTGI